MDNLNNLSRSVKERILTLLKTKAISQKAFAEAIGVDISTITKWKKEKNTSFMKKLDVIAKALGTTEEWLLHGDGDAPPGKEAPAHIPGDGLDAEERRLIHDYRALNPQGQEYIRQTMHMAVQIYKKSLDLSRVEGQG